jgi:hypothetical protein
MQMAIKIQIRRGLASEWSSANPILALGEQGLETDTRKTKFGDGITAYNSLPYSVDKSQIGLSNVDNTSDANKPISVATQSALDLKANSSDVDASLSLKADASSVYTKSETDSIASSTLSSANSYADTKVAAVINSAPATLDTLNELASALGNDANFATSTATLIGSKANASDVYTKSQSDSNFEPKNANIQSHISDTSNPHSTTKAQVGLGNVDNTSDSAKPISVATQSALDLKADSASVYSKTQVYTKTESDSNFESKNSNIQSHIASTSNPHSTTKAQVGLGNVDNTSDISKPISSATQVALDLKANSSDVISELDLKANQSDVTASLSLKANSADVYTKSEVDDISANTLDFANSYADTKVAAIVNSAPATLDTLNELASALGNDPNFATTTATLIGTKANSSDVFTKSESNSNFEPKNANIQTHISSTDNPHLVTKDQVGLGSVDNVSAASLRDRSTHTGTQLASSISDFTSAVQAVSIDASKIDGGNVSNLEFSYLDGVSSPIQSQIDGKEPTITAGNSSQYYRGDKTFQTLDNAAVGLPNVDNVSAVDLRDRTTHTGNESTLTFNEVATPSAPVSGLTIFAESNARQMLGQIPKIGRSYPFQPHIGQSNIQVFLANANVTTSTVLGQAAPTATGTATLRTVALTNTFVSQKRIGYVSAATANQSSGLRSAVLQFGLTNTARVGGFFFQTRFGISDAALVANARTFVGFVPQTTALGNADPSTVLNIIGMGHDAADTNFSIMTNNGTGTANKIDLGSNFSRSPTVSTDMYDLILYVAPNSTTVYYQVTNMRLGVTVSGSTTTKVPVVNTLLTWQLWRQNNGTAAAVGIDIASVYIETEY